MAEYAPIQFVKNIRNYFLGAIDSEKIFDIISSYNSLCEALWLHAVSNEITVDKAENERLFNRLIDEAKKTICNIGNVKDLYGFSRNTLYMYLLNIYTANSWRKNKLSYKIDSELLKQFYEMELPSSIIYDYVLKQPAEEYYIDVSDYGDAIRKGLHGIFITTHIVRGMVEEDKQIHEMLIMRITMYCPGCDHDTSIEHIGIPMNTGELPLSEESFKKDKDKGLLYLNRLIFNFLIYLHASNRDVEISERTRSNHSKPKSDMVKDKFRELKEFEVGVRYGNEIRKNKVRYKYVGEKPESDNHEKRRLTSHYRAAHWHRYWVGTGDNKELITKWVEGTFVKGNIDTDDVIIHKVK